MMNLSSLSPKTIACIARGATGLVQKYYYNSHGWSNHYSVVVDYPNGYSASIICEPRGGRTDIWEVGLLKDGKLDSDDEGWDGIMGDHLTEEEVIEICDRIYFM